MLLCARHAEVRLRTAIVSADSLARGHRVATNGAPARKPVTCGCRGGARMSCCVNLGMHDFFESFVLFIELSHPLRTRIH